jgi:hypothetical protein
MAKKKKLETLSLIVAVLGATAAVVFVGVSAYMVSQTRLVVRKSHASVDACSQGITISVPLPTATPTPIPPTATPTPPACLSCTTNAQCSGDLTCQGSSGIGGSVVSYSLGAFTLPTSKDITSRHGLSMYVGDPYRFTYSATGSRLSPGNGNTTYGKVTYRITSGSLRTATNLQVYVWYIAPKTGIDPQTPVYSADLGAFTANRSREVTITLPTCGRYQIDFAAVATGTGLKTVGITSTHENGYFWGDRDITVNCKPGCCLAHQ